MTRRSDIGTSDGKHRRAKPLIPRPAPPTQSPAEQADTNSAGPSAARGTVASFGPFRLQATERRLEKNGIPLKIGSRALDILNTLLERAPELVSKRELIRLVWGDLVVDEGSLRVHVTELRKRLSDGDSSVTYVTNIPGRGYCFTGAVTWTVAQATPRPTSRAAAPQLPPEPLLMVGRDTTVRELTARLKKQRFVSIIGAGGIGKTTIALTLAHRMRDEFHGAVHFLDLAALEDSRLLASMLATQLGLVAVSDQPLPRILTFLREERLLLVFDNCEHVIEAIAALTENIFRDAARVHILTTSREALRAEGEQVHHLPPLECPPLDVEALTASQALGFPAVQLFVKYADSGHPFELTDSDAPTVAEICRRLDGIPLALGLAASRVGVYGVQGTASLLDRHFRLLWHGRRTALPRHQTLSATLDWSYKLLSGTEQLVFRRLGIFVAGFSLAAAMDVASEGLDTAEVTETLATLVDKSLVTLDDTSAMRYRLLETTGAYASQKLVESGEAQKVARRGGEYLVRALEKFGYKLWARPSPESIEFFRATVGNLRAALEWSFSDQGDAALGAKLTGASACLFLQAGLLPECAAWTERALSVLHASSKGTRLELELLACFSQSLMVTRGNVPAVHAAIVRALDLAERLEDAPMELYLLQVLCKWLIRSGDFRSLREFTSRIETVAKRVADPLAEAIANYYLATACFFTGNNREVQRHLQIALDSPIHLSKLSLAGLNLAGFEDLQKSRIWPRNLWVLGYPEQAMMAGLKAVRDAGELNHPIILCYALNDCLVVALETGEWQRAEELIQRLSSLAAKHHLFTYARACVGWEGCLSVARSDLMRGIHLLQTALAALREDGYELYRPQLCVSLAEGLAKAGQRQAAYNTIHEEVTWAETRGRIVDVISLLRVKGEILISMSPQSAGEAESCLLQALQLAKERGLLSLELRGGMSLARRWSDRGEMPRARDLLEPIFSRFSEGFQTRDLLTAAKLLEELQSRS